MVTELGTNESIKLRQYKDMLENNIIEVITAFDADLWVGTISCFMVYSKK